MAVPENDHGRADESVMELSVMRVKPMDLN
jgi:hypothetical protein